MKKLWSPWRIDYIISPKEDGCIFCDKPAGTEDRENLLLYRGEHSCVLMNLYPYNNGHLMIAPYEHTPEQNGLDTSVLTEIMILANKCMSILSEVFRADGFNLGANIGKAGGAGIEEHLHYHVVPRWSGDTNFMPVVGNTKVMIEGLLETFDKLKPEFDKM